MNKMPNNDSHPKLSQVIYAISLLEEKIDNIAESINKAIESSGTELSEKLEATTSELQSAIADIRSACAVQEEVNLNRLVPVKEASKLLCRSEFCIRQDINEGKIPAKKVGRGYFIVLRDIHDIINRAT